MFKFILLLILSLSLKITNASIDTSHYCRLTTCKKPHVACISDSPLEPPEECRQSDYIVGLTREEEIAIVKYHNECRQYVAEGREKGQPPAKNMPNLIWNDELALLAQMHANQCTAKQHPFCQNIDRFKVGQNIGNRRSHRNITTFQIDDLEKIIDGWYNEVEYFDPTNVIEFRNEKKKGSPEEEEIGHYSQLVWDKSLEIGCGALRFWDPYDKKQRNKVILVCNYGPRGNVLGEPVYEILEEYRK